MTTSVAPTGSTAIAIEKLAHLVALSETFRAGRTWDRALADSIAWWGRETTDDDRQLERPFAVIEGAGGRRFSHVSGGDRDYHMQSGRLWLFMEMDWPAAHLDNHHDATNFCNNYFDAVIEQVMGNAGVDVSPIVGVFQDGSGDLMIPHCEQGAVVKSTPEEFARGERFYATDFEITWGVEGS